MLGRRSPDLVPEGRDCVIALDVKPVDWLRYQALLSPGGTRLGARWRPDPATSGGWQCCDRGDLATLCQDAPEPKPVAPAREAMTAASTAEAERVLLLTLTGADPARNERELAELEGSPAALVPAPWPSVASGKDRSTLRRSGDAENCRKRRWKSASKAQRW